MDAFSGFSASGLYGTPVANVPSSAHHDASPGIAAVAGPAAGDALSLLSPAHPMFVFGVLLAAAAGLIGFSTAGRLGPARASMTVGKS